jgi:acyl carrier protein
VAVDRSRPLPLSYGQQRLWFLAQLEPDSTEYNVPRPIRLEGDLDLDALSRALDALIERHEILRTRLVADDDGVPHQIIDPPVGSGLDRLDVSGEDDPLAAAQALVAESAMTPFDPTAGPLVRYRLIRLGPDDHILDLCLHHLVTDEWSAAIFQRELSVLYQAFGAGDESPLPPLTLQYADYAVWQRDWMSGAVLDDELTFWRERLTDVPVLRLPIDRPRPPVRDSTGRVVEFTLPAVTTEALRTIAQDSGATMFMTLFGALTVLLGRYSGQDDIVVGTPVAGRSLAETEAMIGCFINTLVLRADLSGGPGFTEVLRRTRDDALSAYAHQDLPFEQLVDGLAVERDRSRTPLFQVMFAYAVEAGRPDRSLPGIEAREVGEIPQINTLFDLTLSVTEAGDRITGAFEYATDVFDEATIRRLVNAWLRLLEAIVAEPGRDVWELPVLAESEQAELAARWSAEGTTEQSPEPAFVAPATPEEELMAGIWAAALERDRIGVHDDFFALGGHSLLAIQIVARIRKTFGIRIPLTTIFDNPTVAGLLPVVEALIWDEISRMPDDEVQQALDFHTDDEDGAR